MIRATMDIRSVLRATARVAKRTPVVTAQELNRQRGQVRTLVTRGLSRVTGVKPQRRFRRRIYVPSRLRATALRLAAVGLTLFDTLPARYFVKGAPPGSRLRPAGPDRHGRAPDGGRFAATMPNGYTGQFRRLSPRKWVRRKETPPPRDSGLPIANAFVVDLTPIAYRIRGGALRKMAREWPARWGDRMQGELRRAFG